MSIDHPTPDAQLLIQHIGYTYSIALPAYRYIEKDPLHTALRNSYGGDIIMLGGRREETVPASVASAMKQHASRDGEPVAYANKCKFRSYLYEIWTTTIQPDPLIPPIILRETTEGLLVDEHITHAETWSRSLILRRRKKTIIRRLGRTCCWSTL